MSDLFEDGPSQARPAMPPPSRSRALLITAAVLVVAFLALTGFAAFWTERLWFQSVNFERTFSTLLWTRIGLFVGFGLLLAAIVAANLWLAYRLRPLLVPSARQSPLERYRATVTPMRFLLLAGISLLLGAFGGASASGQWRPYLLWRHGGEFGTTDPYFNRDVGFYVFDLPWLHFMVDFMMLALMLSLLGAALVHYLYGGIRMQGSDRFSPATQSHLSVLLGLTVLTKAADYWLDRFDLLTRTNDRFTGMSFTADNAILPATNILIGIAVICALLFAANVVLRTWMLPTVGLALLVLSAVLLGMIWPGVVQRFQVRPSEPQKEAPYIQANIDATRQAYDIADVAETPYSGAVEEDAVQLRQDAVQAGIRLVDPALVNQTFEQKQQVRGYYSVSDVLDVDRYTINGDVRDVVVGVRELDQGGIPADSQNWANLHTVYTHGYGLIAAYGNQRDADNQEATSVAEGGSDLIWAEENLPPRGEISELAGDEGYRGGIYFGEQTTNYAIVGKPDDGEDIEVDLPTGGEENEPRKSTYDGEAGVGIGSLMRKVLFAVRFSEPNLVLSGRVHDNSKILFDRNPRQMVEKVAPWLTVDNDSFPAMVDGRIVWILDGYTTTDEYPLSQSESFDTMTDDALRQETQFRTLPTDEINYMRNAVKATVDAYDGTVTLYAWQEDDPLLQAWREVFPGTVKPRSEIPESLIPHLRYPEDLFKVQRYLLQTYHVTDADTFYQGDNAWAVSKDPNKNSRLQPPYRLSVRVPGEPEPRFSLTSVYTPNNRENLAAFVAVDADAGDEEGYGTIRVLRLNNESQIDGPAQIANSFSADQELKDRLLPFERNSRVEYGNLLTLPVGEGLMYVQPIYTIRQESEGAYPLLQFVVVSFGGDEVGVGRTLGDAISNILGEEPEPVDPGTDGPPSTGNPDPDPEFAGTLNGEVRRLLRLADAKFAEAARLQRQGDTAGWATALEEAQAYVEQAIAAAEKAEQAREQSRKDKQKSQ